MNENAESTAASTSFFMISLLERCLLTITPRAAPAPAARPYGSDDGKNAVGAQTTVTNIVVISAG